MNYSSRFFTLSHLINIGNFALSHCPTLPWTSSSVLCHCPIRKLLGNYGVPLYRMAVDLIVSFGLLSHPKIIRTFALSHCPILAWTSCSFLRHCSINKLLENSSRPTVPYCRGFYSTFRKCTPFRPIRKLLVNYVHSTSLRIFYPVDNIFV